MIGNSKMSRRRGVTVVAPVVSGLLTLAACGGAGSTSTQMRSAPAAERAAEPAERAAEPEAEAGAEPAQPAAEAGAEPAQPGAEPEAEAGAEPAEPAQPGAEAGAEPTQPAAEAGAEPTEALADPAARQPQMRQVIELVSAGGVGRMYTLNEQEAQTAVTQHRMTRQPATGILMSSTRFEGSQAVWRLKPSRAANTWLLTPSEAERDHLVNDLGWVLDGSYPIVGYVHREDGPGRERLMRYSLNDARRDEWRVALEGEAPAGYSEDGPIGYVDVTG